MTRGKRGFGQIDQLGSGKFRARYMHEGRRHTAPVTFLSKPEAAVWLSNEHVRVSGPGWTPPAVRLLEERAEQGRTVGEYGAHVIATRKKRDGKTPIKQRTREHYTDLMRDHISPTFADMPLAHVTPAHVVAWHDQTLPHAPTYRAHAYGLLLTIFQSAVDDRLLMSNPCQLKGAGKSPSKRRKLRIASVEEVALLVKNMPERLQAMVLLAGWMGLRFGELTELRRSDVDLTHGMLHVERGAVRLRGVGIVEGTTKSDAGERSLPIPPHLLPVLVEHLSEHVGAAGSSLLFPAATDPTKNLAHSTFVKSYYPARKAAGRPELRLHDLRHTAGTRLAQQGATMAELMGFLGHSTHQAAIRYQHAAEDRMTELARRMSLVATGG